MVERVVGELVARRGEGLGAVARDVVVEVAADDEEGAGHAERVEELQVAGDGARVDGVGGGVVGHREPVDRVVAGDLVEVDAEGAELHGWGREVPARGAPCQPARRLASNPEDMTLPDHAPDGAVARGVAPR